MSNTDMYADDSPVHTNAKTKSWYGQHKTLVYGQ